MCIFPDKIFMSSQTVFLASVKVSKKSWCDFCKQSPTWIKLKNMRKNFQAKNSNETNGRVSERMKKLKVKYYMYAVYSIGVWFCICFFIVSLFSFSTGNIRYLIFVSTFLSICEWNDRNSTIRAECGLRPNE